MIAMPAVDLRGGACVQLVGGSYANERVRLEHPEDVAHSWAHYGFNRLHVVDLDAATGRGENSAIVSQVLADRRTDIQVGGGVRSEDAIERLLDDGAVAVILGTRAVEEPHWVAEVAEAYAGSLIVAADVRDRKVVARGWTRTLPRHVFDVVEELGELPLAGILVTAVHREGQMGGTDLPLMEDIVELSSVPIFASGGITTMQDLRALADRGVSAAVIGMALYTGALDPRAVAEEFNEWP